MPVDRRVPGPATAASRLRSAAFRLLLVANVLVLGLSFVPILLLSSRFVMIVVRLWALVALALLRWVAGISFEIRGLERLPAGPALIAAKHQSAWETIVFLTLLPWPVYVLKRELLSLPVFGWYVQRVGGIAVDRQGGAGALRRLILSARSVVAQGRPIVIFPEGTRVAPGKLLPLQPGVVALYQALGVPLVPVSLNAGLFWRRGVFDMRPGRILCEVAPAIPPGLDRAEVMRRLTQAIGEGTRRLEREAGFDAAEPVPAPQAAQESTAES